MPDQTIIEMLRQSLRGFLTPRDAPTSPTAIGPLNAIDLPAVPSPYPFRNPITPTKELDEAMRQIRSIAPGAGTTIREITQTPPRAYLKYAAEGNPYRSWEIGDSTDPNPDDEYFRGYTPGLFPSEASEKGNVYINPRVDRQDVSLAGQLARVATPSQEQQDQDARTRNLKNTAPVAIVGVGPGTRDYSIYERDRQKTAEGQYKSYEDFLAALRSAFIGTRK